MNQPPVVRKPWERHRSITDLEGQELKTDQSLGNDTDINNIVARFKRDGYMPPPVNAPVYDDVTNLQEDLTQLIEKGRAATIALQELHSEKAKAAEADLQSRMDKLKAFEDNKTQSEEEAPTD